MLAATVIKRPRCSSIFGLYLTLAKLMAASPGSCGPAGCLPRLSSLCAQHNKRQLCHRSLRWLSSGVLQPLDGETHCVQPTWSTTSGQMCSGTHHLLPATAVHTVGLQSLQLGRAGSNSMHLL